MALTWNRFALFDWANIGDPSIVVLANGVDNVAWTDGLLASRTEATLSTTAPDVSSMSAAETNDGAGEYVDGTYYVYIAYKRDSTTTYPEMISGPSAAKSVTIASGPSDIALTSVPTSSDAQVTDREVYLLGGNLEQPYYVGDIGDNTTTSYTINVAVSTLQANKILSEATSDYPVKRTLAEGLPPKFEFIEVWNNRLWGGAGDTIYFSEPLPKFEDFPSTNSIVIPRRGGTSAKIRQFRVHKRFLYVFYEDAVYQISGTTRDNFAADQLLTGVGTSGGPKSVRSVGDYLYFLDRQLGPVRWSGSGQDIEPIGLLIEGFWERVDKNRLTRACGDYSPRRHEMIWYVTEGRYDRNNRRIAFDTVTGQWSVDHAHATSSGVVRNELGEVCLLEGNSLGDVFQYDLGAADGVYTGTTSGTPTTATGLTLADTTATFGAAADVEGRPVYLFDSDSDLLQVNWVVTRTSATELRLMYPITASVATYTLGLIPLIRESGPTNLDEDGAALWQHITVRYKPTTTAYTVYFDLKNEEDADYENVATFSSDGDGMEKLVVFKRGDDMTWRIRCNGHVEFYDVTIMGSPTGGF